MPAYLAVAEVDIDGLVLGHDLVGIEAETGEAEQRAWDEQGEDWNREVFPLILDVRDVLRSNGVPIRSGSALCGAASLCGAPGGGCRSATGD